MKARGLGRSFHIAHVGYHKTASTWLQLSVFPHLAGLRFADARLRRLGITIATVARGAFAAEGARRAVSEIASASGERILLSNEGLSGSLWDGDDSGLRSAERLARVLPGARILLLVRRQDEMLRSIHAQYVNEGGTRSLDDFVTGGPVEGSCFRLRHLEYDRLAARYAELFGGDRVRVVPYERLRAEPDAFLAELCEFLGTVLTAEVSRARLNRSLSPLSLRLLRGWNRLFRASRFNPRPVVAALPGGSRVRTLAQRRVDPALWPLTRSVGSRRDASVLRTLAGGFADSNQRLQALCPHSLAEWGYPLRAAATIRPADVAVGSGSR
jgi:hypothetical protein